MYQKELVIILFCIVICIAPLTLAMATPSGDDLFKMSLEELMDVDVESAGFFTSTATKVPGYVMVYDMNEISNSSVRTLADLIELYVPGAIVGGHERQGRLIGTRGLMIDNNAKTLVMWDGQQINYRAHFGYMVGMLSPFLGDVDRVEVIHGPGVIQHGSGAISGFINMIPKTGTKHPGLFSRYEFGIAETAHLLEGGYGYSYGENRDIYVYGGLYHATGFEPDQSWGSTKVYSGDINAFAYTNSNYRFSTTWNHGNFNLNYFVYDLNPQKNNNEEAGYFKNETMGFRPKYTFELSDTDSIDLIGSFLLMDHATQGHGPSNDLKGGSEKHWETKLVYKTTQFDSHLFAIGGVFGQKSFRDGKLYFSRRPVTGFESMTTRWDEMGVFAEDVITLSDQLTLSMGVRYDKFDTTTFSKGSSPALTPDSMDGHISPRIALAYEIDDTSTIKGSYQHGYRTPDVAYYDWNLTNNAAAKALGYPTSTLKPEEMDSYEINLQKVMNSRLTINANAYYNVFKDQLKWDGLTNQWTQAQADAINAYNGVGWGGGMFQNIEGKYQIYGTELVADYKLTDNTDLGCSYGFAKVNNYDVAQLYPTHQVKVNLMSRLLNDKLLVGINYVYNSSYTHEMSSGLNDDYENSRHLVDLSMVYHVNKHLKLKGIVKNIFGNQTPPPPPGGAAQEGNMGYADPRIYISAEMTF